MPEAPEAIEWDDEAFAEALKKASEGVIEASGRRVSWQQLTRLLDAAPPSHRPGPLLTKVDFVRATFERADFRGATFNEVADFGGATFNEGADFGGATFNGVAGFSRATFNEGADFGGATFNGLAGFHGATFNGVAGFSQATFNEGPDFGGATFNEGAGFRAATFDDGADFGGASFNEGAGFRAATFNGVTGFSGATFDDGADFGGATFNEGAGFRAATFKGAGFRGATIREFADFGGATFNEFAHFREATFSGFADFRGATFKGGADFREATFNEGANFGVSTFSDHAHFGKAIFGGSAVFLGVTFGGSAFFFEVTFRENADFRDASFERETAFGPVHVYDRLWLDEAVFAQRVRIEASAARASFARATFPAGADLRLRWAELWLEDSVFAEPSLVTGLQPRLTPEGGKPFLGWEKPRSDGTWDRVEGDPPERFAPRVLSARGARVANLTLSGVNLGSCRFAGAHGLDELRLERVVLLNTPEGWQRTHGWPMQWTHRRTIAEERQWRTQERDEAGWTSNEDEPHQPPTVVSEQSGSARPPRWPPEQIDALDPEEIAALYRRLRKGCEDSKNAPGANDFYYGEMEMRRHSAPWAERVILWLYWLFPGYGLRGSRALVALLVTIALGAIPLASWGFHPDRSYGRALLFALESSISLLRAPQAKLSAGGEVTQIILRLAGPLFFGLALLALRARVKR